jgi:HAD superfamily hydrolase (TIGR01490 family)
MHKRTIVAFDFDGTLTSKDTFLELIKFTFGKFRFLFGFILFFHLLIAYKFKIYPNWKVKQTIFSYFFKGMSLSAFNNTCEKFAENNKHLIRPKAINKINDYLRMDYELIIISASIENWIVPFANKLGINSVICTKAETNKSNILTGNFSTSNCYGKEKINRLLEKYPERENYYLIAYGDSNGDRELLTLADEKYYNEFV